jgi:hypothetical protein
VSISSVSSTSNSLTEGLANWASMMKKVQSEFTQLGQDLQSGKVTQAESDYTTLTQDLSSFSSNSASADTANADSTTSADSSTSSLADALNTLGQDLQSGNLSAAQSDFTTVQNDLQQATNQAPPPPPPPPSNTRTSTSTNSILKELNALGDALSSSDLTSAQTAYSTLQQDLLQLGVNGLTSQLGTGQVSLSG